jgi:hypothetical protein
MAELLVASIFLLLLAVPLGLLYYFHKDTKTIAKEWDDVAQRMGLGRYRKLREHYGISGPLRGLHATAYWITTGTVEQHTCTYLSVDTNTASPAGLRVEPEGVWTKVFGGVDAEVGAPAFDRAFSVKGVDEATSRAYLGDPRRQAALLDLRKMGSDYAYMADGTISCTFHYLLDGERVELRLTQLIDIAHRFSSQG